MHVAFRLVGQLEVDHVGNPRDVDPARCDIRCDEYPFLALLEALEGFAAGALGLIAVDRAGLNACSVQAPGHAISAVLGAGKDDGLAHVIAGEELAKELWLCVALYGVDALFDGINGHHFRSDFHTHRVLQEGIGQLGDFSGHGCGEEQGLAGSWEVRNDSADIGNEAHIQKPVGLVEHQMAHFPETHHALAHKVDKPSRGGDQDFRAAGQGLSLRPKGCAAEDAETAGFTPCREAADFRLDLGSQFSGWSKNQRPGAPGAGPPRIGELFDNGEGEGCRLPRPGLGNAQYVLTGEQLRDGFCLDRRRGSETCASEHLA